MTAGPLTKEQAEIVGRTFTALLPTFSTQAAKEQAESIVDSLRSYGQTWRVAVRCEHSVICAVDWTYERARSCVHCHGTGWKIKGVRDEH